MDTLLNQQGGMVDKVVGNIKKDLNKRNVRGGYNTHQLMVYIRKHTDRVVLRLNRLGSRCGGIAGDNDERHKLFESWPLHTWGSKLQGLPHHWDYQRLHLIVPF
eukprot:1118191-Ditylum_brightwellii.AAC.1